MEVERQTSLGPGASPRDELPQVWDQIQYLKGFVPVANFVEGWVTKVTPPKF